MTTPQWTCPYCQYRADKNYKNWEERFADHLDRCDQKPQPACICANGEIDVCGSPDPLCPATVHNRKPLPPDPPPEWVKRLWREISCVAVNYGIRARCLEALNQPPDPLPKEILEAHEEGASEAGMAVLRVLATVFPQYADELRWIEHGDDDTHEHRSPDGDGLALCDATSDRNTGNEPPQGGLKAKLVAGSEPADAHRLTQQAQDISVLLSDAGIGPGSLPEGVRTLIAQRDAARACVFRSHQGCAFCGTHWVNLEHAGGDTGWRCPVTGTLFDYGTPLNTTAQIAEEPT